jgi:hypothetical protein
MSEPNKSSSWHPDTTMGPHKKKATIWFNSLINIGEDNVYAALDDAAWKPISLTVNAHQTHRFARLSDTEYFELRVSAKSAIFLHYKNGAYHCIDRAFHFNKMVPYKSLKSLLMNRSVEFLCEEAEIQQELRLWFPRIEEMKIEPKVSVTTNNKPVQEKQIDDFDGMFDAFLPKNNNNNNK